MARRPHNPGLRDLIVAKQKANPTALPDLKGGFRGWHERGYLPHCDRPGLTQFVTFNLADAFPVSLRNEWKTLLKIESDGERRLQLEAYLDKGNGACHFKNPDLARIVEETFRFYHARRYDLKAWVVMPNHVHVLFKTDTVPMREIIADWKAYSAREVNKRLQRKGTVWAADYWDTYIRNAQHELTSRRYIENNPVKAFLVQDPQTWPWSSARFRDLNGLLHL